MNNFTNFQHQNFQQNLDNLGEKFCPFYFKCDSFCLEQSYQYNFGIAGILMFISLIFSFYYILRHFQHFTNPHFQSKIIIILLMAPFYATISMSSIIFNEAEIYLTLIRDVYEAFLLFTFFYLIFSYLAYDQEQQQIIDERVYILMCQSQKEIHHMFPFNKCTKPYKLTSTAKAKYFTYRCKKFVLQCFVLKPICSLILIILAIFQEYSIPFIVQNINQKYIKKINKYGIEIFMKIVIAISVTYSLYYLILFYYALKKPLSPFHPLLKFLTIKIILFFTFWQTITLQLFGSYLLECFDQNSIFFEEQRIISGIENTLVCFEMVIMSIAGGIAFSYKPFIDGVIKKVNILDVIKDNASTFKKDFRLIKPRKMGFKAKTEQSKYNPTGPSQQQEIQIEMFQKTSDLNKSLLQAYV
ncbi:transmembrane protein 184c, putative [Ichthyophthirius multifiliis]|uniref:Transmembrane protein 184c, putative n=1 Tax=Ichthyophthirius multifiliis TaxID=5932 RepID=G0QV75_ICHMU|nr:transmembrane protein 184c, putative [Ichthyophthirius multifiliis]EGR30876.1 transmembrane protein 184c, putative [Ichthyophthirius multifiliis]|eukprot:XP_004032463.1 transmembrane protein 184c, putative [Ichthyophthirius multifiliis]